jgi:polyhydroxyalkanoate synthesis regulator phasin
MATERPLWRKGFDAVERPVARRLETLVQGEQFLDVLAVATHVQRRLSRRLERAQRRLLHIGNLPARTDVARLSEQVARLERQLRDVSKRLEDEEDAHAEHPDAR